MLQPSDMALRFGDCLLDPATRTLRRGGRPLPLGARAYDLLLALVRARGQLVTKDELLQQAWPGLVVEEANVHVQVSALRKLLGAQTIATVAGLGYRLAQAVTEHGAVAPPHNLPAERTVFIGRQALLADVQARAARARLLTLVGIGGTGKTRVARKLAERLLPLQADGVWWLDLAPLDRPEQIGPALAQVLGCRADAQADALHALMAALRERRCLLVLDNCEHLVDAVAAMVDPLLDAAPGLQVLATSREALGVRAELLLPVKPLELPPPQSGPDAIWASEAVQLFLQAAAQAHEGFAPDEADAATLAAICRQLDGIPLALELAASQLRVVAPAQLLEVLRQRFAPLLSQRRALPRQQTLRAVVRWSFDNLQPDEHRLLLALSTTAGGCDLDAARDLMADGDPRPQGLAVAALMAALSRLAGLSLLTVTHEGGRARYGLLETVREFAAEELHASGGEAPARDRHRDHYAAHALQAGQALRDLTRPETRPEALRQLDRERDNIARALDWTVAAGPWNLAAQLVHALLPYWTSRGLLAAGLEQALAVQAGTPPDADPRPRAQAAIDAAHLALRLGRVPLARDLAGQARPAAEAAGAAELVIASRLAEAFCTLADDDPVQARQVLDAALVDARRAGLLAPQADIHNALGQVAVRLGELAAAREQFAQALVLEERRGNRSGVAMERLNLAFVAMRTPDAAELRRLALLAAPEVMRLDHHYHGSALLDVAGALAAFEGDAARCLQFHRASHRHFERAGYTGGAERRQRQAADMAWARSRLEPEAQRLAEARADAGTLHDDLVEVLDWLGLSEPMDAAA